MDSGTLSLLSQTVNVVLAYRSGSGTERQRRGEMTRSVNARMGIELNKKRPIQPGQDRPVVPGSNFTRS